MTGLDRAWGVLRLVALYLFLAALIFVARPTPLSVTIGFVFVAAGELLRLWAAGHLRKTVELITSGPYRYTRNPMYLGRLLIFTGLCIMARVPYYGNVVLLVAGYAVFFGYYLARKERVEPARLRELHGETYNRYHRAVPALFPTLTPYPESAGSGWSSQRMLRNREHWMLTALLALALVLLWISYARPEGLLQRWISGW